MKDRIEGLKIVPYAQSKDFRQSPASEKILGFEKEYQERLATGRLPSSEASPSLSDQNTLDETH
jgi:hypothetical protein